MADHKFNRLIPDSEWDAWMEERTGKKREVRDAEFKKVYEKHAARFAARIPSYEADGVTIVSSGNENEIKHPITALNLSVV